MSAERNLSIRTGSQTTNTRTGRPPTFFSTSPSAEAPRTQTGQVGETIAPRLVTQFSVATRL